MSDKKATPAAPAPQSRAGVYNVSLVLLAGVLGAVCCIVLMMMQDMQRAQFVIVQAETHREHIQRVAQSLEAYKRSREQMYLDRIKDAAVRMSANQDFIQAALLGGQPYLDRSLRSFIDAALLYAAAPYRPKAQKHSNIVADLVAGDMLDRLRQQINFLRQSSQQQMLLYIYMILGLCASGLLILFYQFSAFFRPIMDHMRKQQDYLNRVAAMDMLTRCYNRAMLFKVAGSYFSGAKRHGTNLSVLVVDIDDCKILNDQYGHATGDLAIQTIAKALRNTLRATDVIGRIGGEEFAVFLPSTDEYRASLVAEKLRDAVISIPFAINDKDVPLRISIGAAQIQPSYAAPEDMIRAAEIALRDAKQKGGNCVALFSEMPANAVV